MTISIKGFKATPIPILRGRPQGSVLGCLLYCATTQSLSKDLGHPPGEGAVFFPQDGSDDESIEMWTIDCGSGDQPEAFLYVDDTTIFCKRPMSEAVRHLTTNTTVETLDCPELGAAFDNLERRASDIGMKINKKKTLLLVIPTPSCTTEATMLVAGTDVVHSQNEMRLVGFIFGDTPGVGRHVEQIRSRFSSKVWMLYHLQKAGFRDGQLYRLYCCYVRTIIEYCSVVYHPLLNRGQEEDLERLHRHDIRVCFGTDEPVREVMESLGIETLKSRRERRCDKFILKAASNPLFRARWFQRRPDSGHNLRRRREIIEPRAATNRRYNSPLAFIQRRANQLGVAGF